MDSTAPSTPTAPLPAGGVLLHIGPFKTGTTSLQGAFHIAREQLAANDVHYAGRNRQPMLAALALTGRPGRRGDTPAEPRHWQGLVDEVTSFEGRKRVVVSSEFFADADEDRAREAVAALGGSRVHVVITLRPLAKIMPSQWQQYVQNGLRMGYDQWLDHMLNQPPYDKPTPTFWNRHDHAELLRRWVSVAGADNLTVIVVDDSERLGLLRTFESLLELPDGLLVPEAERSNRSLSLSEVQLVRLLNGEFKRRKWSEANYRRFVREAVVKPLLARRQPLPDEPAITTPAWALDRASEIGAKTVQAIADSGVQVIGDPDVLVRADAASRGGAAAPDSLLLPVSAVAMTVVNTIIAGRKAKWPNKAGVPEPEPVSRQAIAIEDRRVASVDSGDLARVLLDRGRRRIQIKRHQRRA